MAQNEIKKVVLAYSGGLDTSVILKWLEDEYGCEVVTFTADIGQGEEVEPARAKAEAAGIKEIYIDDLREEFVRDFVFPMFRANAIYEGEYLLGTSIARPLIAKRLIEIASETGADAISHGATGKGNDQVRFELGAYALKPDVKIIAPWREWDLLSREKAAGLRRDPRHPGGDEARGHQVPLLHGRQPAAHLLRGLRPGGPLDRARRGHVALDRLAGEGTGRAHLHRDDLRAGRLRRHRRRGHEPGRGAGRAQPRSAAPTASAAPTSWRTATWA